MTTGTQLVDLTDSIYSITAAVHDVIAAGLQLLVAIYGGKPGESLNTLRYAMQCKMVSASLLQPQKLPLTENASKFHIMRAHLRAILCFKGMWELLQCFVRTSLFDLVYFMILPGLHVLLLRKHFLLTVTVLFSYLYMFLDNFAGHAIAVLLASLYICNLVIL